MKQGFDAADGERVGVETAFKNPDHPFRVAIVCAMWLTGFDVECLSTLYIDKPMKAHTLMQAIARVSNDIGNPSSVLPQVALLPSTSVSPFEVIPLGAGTISGAAPATC